LLINVVLREWLAFLFFKKPLGLKFWINYKKFRNCFFFFMRNVSFLLVFAGRGLHYRDLFAAILKTYICRYIENIYLQLYWKYIFADILKIYICSYIENMYLQIYWKYIFAAILKIYICSFIENIYLQLYWKYIYLQLYWTYISAAILKIYICLHYPNIVCLSYLNYKRQFDLSNALIWNEHAVFTKYSLSLA